MFCYSNERQNRCDDEEPNIWCSQIHIHDVPPLGGLIDISRTAPSRMKRPRRVGVARLKRSSNASYDLAPIVIDNAAFSYQSSDLKTVDRLTFLRSTPFVLSDWELGVLRSNFDDGSRFTTEKQCLPPRTKLSLTLNQRRFIRDSPDSSRIGVNGSDFLVAWKPKFEVPPTPAFQASPMAFEGLIWPFSWAFRRTPRVCCS